MSSWFNYFGPFLGESEYEKKMMESMEQTRALKNYVIDDNNIRLLCHSYRVAKDPEYAKQWPISPPEDKRYWYQSKLPDALLDHPIGDWNVSRVTNMFGLFFGWSSFNEPLNNWNVSNVINMSRMFHGCTSFNQPLDKWNVSNVTKMEEMFYGCTSFNQPLNNWNVSNVREYQNFGVRQQNMPNFILQEQPQGLAFEIHNVFKELDFTKFMQIIRKENNNANHFKNPDNIFEHYIRYINGAETKLIDDKKTNQKTKILKAITSPDGKIFSSLNGYLNEHPEYKNDVLEVLQFVLSQPTKYKDLYIESFENECIKAYSSTESTASCSKGVFERIFFINKSTILGMCFNEITGSTSGASADCRPVYIELYNCFYPEIDINLIFKEWYDKFSFDAIPQEKNPLTNLSVEERIEHYRNFALTKEPKLNSKTLNDSITKNPNIFKTLLIDGGGRKRKSIKRKSIKRKRHRSKKNKHGEKYNKHFK